MTRARYALGLALAVMAIFAAAVVTFARLAERDDRPLALAAGEVSDTFDVHRAGDLGASPEDYRRFAVEDSIWRVRNERMMRRWRESSGSVWRPSPRQVVTDSAWHHVQAGRLAEAAALLGRWLVRHPDDDDLRVEHARLLAQTRQTDSALAEYERVVARRSRDVELRAELAGAYLQAGRYDRAAMAFRALAAQSPGRGQFELGLARALAWGDHPRDAEPILAGLARRFPGDTTIREMLRSSRAGFEPSAAEAARWLREDPSHWPYRIALARALARARRFREAVVQWDTVLANGETVQLLREAAGVRAAGGDSVGTAALLARAVRLEPADTSLRRGYARALAWAGERPAAIEQLGVLIGRGPREEDVFMRAQLRLWSGDERGAETDLLLASQLAPRAETYGLLGDLYRWRGDWKRARNAYRRALELRPGNAAILASLEAVERAERAAFAAEARAALGWTGVVTHSEDNTGFLFLAASLQRGFALGGSTTLAIGVEQRRISQRTPDGREEYLYGSAIDLGAEHAGRHVQGGGRIGIARHALVRDMVYASLAVGTIVRGARVTVGGSTGPMYASMMTTRALVRRAPMESRLATPLRGHEASASVTLPIGMAEAWLGGGILRLSDGNRRSSLQGSLRVPIAPHFAALYSGGTLGFSQQSEVYWDPTRYTSHSVGVEVARRQPLGLSFAARVLPGVARSIEQVAIPGVAPAASTSRNVRQLFAGYELTWSDRRWRALVDGSYARGREGGYQALNTQARVQVDW
ncbi:MAG TPA: tetratricopeptide repeat protein [Gemmatimonadaceae bacterium]|nr:tetratricopeptide repeat protein [Gemmatimonadaceae bacterium]